MINRDRPFDVFNRNTNDSTFAGGAAVTVTVPCSGMRRFTFDGRFTVAPGTLPTVAWSADGVNFDETDTINAVTGSSSLLYKYDKDVGSWKFVQLVVTPAASGTQRLDAKLWPIGEAQNV